MFAEQINAELLFFYSLGMKISSQLKDNSPAFVLLRHCFSHCARLTGRLHNLWQCTVKQWERTWCSLFCDVMLNVVNPTQSGTCLRKIAGGGFLSGKYKKKQKICTFSIAFVRDSMQHKTKTLSPTSALFNETKFV